MKNLLRGSTVYLAGAVEHNDSPFSWRQDITDNLFRPMGVRVYNPLIKPSWMSELARDQPTEFRNWMKDYQEWIQSGRDYDITTKSPNAIGIWEVLREVRVFCRRSVFSSDFMVVNLPKKFTTGTFEEITIAVQVGMPVLIHSPDGILSSWLPDMLTSSINYDHRNNGNCPYMGEEYFTDCHFDNWESLYQYIEDVDSGAKDVNNFKWLFASYFNDPLVNDEIPNNQQA